MSLQSVILVNFGQFTADFLGKVAVMVHKEFMYEVEVKDGHLDLSESFDKIRNQYNANDLLQMTDVFFSSEHSKTIGLFNVDLFIPIFTHIFGQAYLGGRTGIASIFRLGNERYGIEANEDVLLERFSKEVIHELGHCFGLVHCYDPACVMRSSTYVEDIDQKGLGLCLKCREVAEM